jgi:hypothetical protein
MHTTTTTAPDALRTYGNWRKPTSPGIGKLGLAGTMVLMVGLVAFVIAMAINLFLAGAVAVVVGIVLVPFVAVDHHGRNGFQAVGSRLAWRRGKASGATLYRSGPLATRGSGRFSLPGLGAALAPLEALDAHGRPFVLLHHPRTGHVSAVLQTSPEGAALVDTDQVNQWVASWGEWLSALGMEPSLVAASVTIESAPDPGTRLRREVGGRISDDAPALARSVLEEIVRTYPAGSPAITCRVALTWTRNSRVGGKRRTVQQMAVEVGRRLPGLSAGLGATGAGPARPMTSGELSSAVRIAYDPSAQVLIESAGTGGCEWEDAGPAGAEETIGSYAHDGAVSVTWSMTSAPAGAIHCGVLAGLLAPHPDIARKRVTLLYRPYTPAAATKIVERDRKDTLFKANASKVALARDVQAVAAANKTAQEDAQGAGLVRFGMLVTATVAAGDPEAVALAEAAVEALSVTSRIGLRKVYRSQATAFQAALPLGFVLGDHLKVPSTVREAM